MEGWNKGRKLEEHAMTQLHAVLRKNILAVWEKVTAVHKKHQKKKESEIFCSVFVLFLSEGYPNENSKFTRMTSNRNIHY